MLATSAAATSRAGELPSYRLAVRIDPPAGTLDARAEIRGGGASEFSLSRDLTVSRVLADGRPVAFENRPAAPGDAARAVMVAAPAAETLTIEYGGRIRPETYPKMSSAVNMIDGALVELATYVAWYPRIAAPGGFEVRLTADLPAGFVTLANGRLTGERSEAGRTITEWSSGGPAWDIALVSAPALRRTAVVRNGVTTEIYSRDVPQAYVERMAHDVARSLEEIAAIVGAAPPTDLVRVVYAPRAGWGYVRTPLIIVSGEQARTLAGVPSGAARDLRYLAHEMAHYWWHTADMATPEDWINEGLSEYTAYLVSQRVSGDEFGRSLLDEYRDRSASSTTTVAILETQNDSPDREINRYARPVLVLEELRRRAGDEAVSDFLRTLYRRFASDGRATTTAVLDVAGTRLGPDARARLAHALARSDWSTALAKVPSGPVDEAFRGTWVGTLTQGSVTNEVVLHLSIEAGRLAAALETLDPKAPPIALPGAAVAGRGLTFVVGAFGIRYEGTLGGDGATLTGTWRQGGVDVPLTLTKRAAGTR
jgi:hypothetical protein